MSVFSEPGRRWLAGLAVAGVGAAGAIGFAWPKEQEPATGYVCGM
ncbi:hypothetical protein [Actinoplanes sp. NPDC051494]